MKLKKNIESSLKTTGFIKKTGLIILASGIFFSCNDGNKKDGDADIELDPTLEAEEDTISNYAYEGNAVADYLTYVDGEDEYEEMQEEIDPETALQKFAAAVSERSREFGMQADQELEVVGDSISKPVGDMKVQLETTIAAFEKLQENAYDELSEEVDELKAELQEIDMQADDAKENLRSFFNKAADVMEEMEAPTSEGTMSIDPGVADTLYSDEPDTIEADQ